MEPIKLVRTNEVFDLLNISKSGYRKAAKEGRMPKFIKIGERGSALANYEIDQLIRAQISGLSKDETRKLVERIHADRIRVGIELSGDVA